MCILTHLPYYLLPPCSITDEQGDTERWCKRVGKSEDKPCVALNLSSSYKCDSIENDINTAGRTSTMEYGSYVHTPHHLQPKSYPLCP